MSWSIVEAERKLPLGPIDNWLFGEDASHGYIRIKDGKGNPVLEFHGCARELFEGKRAHIKFGLSFVFGFVADSLLGRPSKVGPLLQVKALTRREDMEALNKGRPITEHVFFEGSKKDVLRRVESALRAAHIINQSDLRYMFYAFNNEDEGQNCHSVRRGLRKWMTGTTPQKSPHYANPGLQRALEHHESQLSDVTPRHDRSISHIKKSIRTLLPEVDPNPSPNLRWLSFWNNPFRDFHFRLSHGGPKLTF